MITNINPDVLVYLCGAYSLAFAIFHIAFWKLFSWKEELAKLSRANRGIMQILNLRIIYLLTGAATVCFCYTDTLSGTSLGNAILLFLSLFWLGRAIEQLIFFRVNNWRVHVLTVIFFIGSLLHFLPVICLGRKG